MTVCASFALFPESKSSPVDAISFCVLVMLDGLYSVCVGEEIVSVCCALASRIKRLKIINNPTLKFYEWLYMDLGYI